MKFFLILLIAIFTTAGALIAQQKFTPLKPGDKVPDVPLKFFRPEHNGIKFSDYKGKVLILDFWATWCSACIAGLPKVHELQKKYSADAQFILVNDAESKEKVDRFMAKGERIPNLKITLPVVLGDSLLTKVVFKHVHLPDYFWIGRDGTVKYETLVTDVIEKNIKSFIQYGKIELQSDQPLYSDSADQTIKDGTLWKTELGSGKVRGTTDVAFKASGESRLTCFNNSVIDLYRFAYGDFRTGPKRERSFVLRFPFDRVLYESVKPFNPGRHLFNRDQSDSLFFYKMTAPDFSSWEKMSSVMISELDNCFSYKTAIEKRTVKYLSLTIPDSTRFANVSGPIVEIASDTRFSLNNITIRDFLRTLNANHEWGRLYLLAYPIVDESGYKGKVGNIVIENINTNDPVALERELSKFGISLRLVERPVDMLVIRDKKQEKL